MKKNILSFFSLLFLSFGSMSGHEVMTQEDYVNIEIGTSVQKLLDIAGKPYEIKKYPNNEQEYEYIERIKAADDLTIKTNHYYFYIKDKKITKKRMEIESVPPLDQRNSYELQTSQI